MNTKIERLRRLAQDALDEYHAGMKGGGEPIYPGWADDLLDVLNARTTQDTPTPAAELQTRLTAALNVLYDIGHEVLKSASGEAWYISNLARDEYERQRELPVIVGDKK